MARNAPQPAAPVKATQPAPAAPEPLLIDACLPHYDVAIAHARIFPAPPEACYAAAMRIDLLRDPVVRTLLALRTLPHRLVRGPDADRDVPPRTFGLRDMIGPPLNWALLGERPGMELTLGQIGRPWQSAALPRTPPTTPAAFAAFTEPGYAKIVFSLHVAPHGRTASIVTSETRVALTDPASRRRFARYWRLIGPFSELIRRIALRQLDRELRGVQPPMDLQDQEMPMNDQRPLPRATAALAEARCVARFCTLLAHRQIHQPRRYVGKHLHFADGTAARVYRETVVEDAVADPCVLVVAFRLRFVRGWGHPLFRGESLLNTPLFVGFPGYRAKLWLAHDQHGVYRGVYAWDGSAQAEAYARALWRVLELVCVPGTIAYHVLPGLQRDAWLAAPQLVAPASAMEETAWWRLVDVT